MSAGLQIYDLDGTTVLAEVGGQVLERSQGLAAAVGLISSSWAHLEAQMGGYMAALLETSPERTFALLEQFRSASATSSAAESLARQTLAEPELQSFLDIVKEFRELARQRNHIQHAVWTWKAHDSTAVYRAPAVEFAVLMLRFFGTENPQAVAEAFVESLEDRYDAERLAAIRAKIEALLERLTVLAIQRHRAFAGGPL